MWKATTPLQVHKRNADDILSDMLSLKIFLLVTCKKCHLSHFFEFGCRLLVYGAAFPDVLSLQNMNYISITFHSQRSARRCILYLVDRLRF